MAFSSGDLDLIDAIVSSMINLATSFAKLYVNVLDLALTKGNSVYGYLVTLCQVLFQQSSNGRSKSSLYLVSTFLFLYRLRLYHCLLGRRRCNCRLFHLVRFSHSIS